GFSLLTAYLWHRVEGGDAAMPREASLASEIRAGMQGLPKDVYIVAVGLVALTAALVWCFR
ncbi:MAG: hypothetical protein ACX94A_13015, partial [Algiphilus sp.]